MYFSTSKSAFTLPFFPVHLLRNTRLSDEKALNDNSFSGGDGGLRQT